MNKEELKEIRTTISWLFGNGDFKNEEKALDKYKDSINKLNEAINYTRCCKTLKTKELMTFEDYKNNLFIKVDGVYQPKKTKLFVWYSEKQLKKMYKDKPL